MNAFEQMTLSDLVTKIAGCFAAVSFVIQISPIRLNPWSKIFGWFGKMINKEVLDKISALETKVQGVENDLIKVKHRMGEKSARDARTRILRFGDEILHGVRHSKEHFDEVMLYITEYGEYCKTHPEFKNQMTESTTKVIVDEYERCLRDHGFLNYVIDAH